MTLLKQVFCLGLIDTYMQKKCFDRCTEVYFPHEIMTDRRRDIQTNRQTDEGNKYRRFAIKDARLLKYLKLIFSITLYIP